MIVNQLEANKERFRPEGFDQIRPHAIRSLQFDQKVRPLSFRPEKFDLFTATPKKNDQQTTQTSHYPSGPVATVFVEAAMIYIIQSKSHNRKC